MLHSTEIIRSRVKNMIDYKAEISKLLSMMVEERSFDSNELRRAPEGNMIIYHNGPYLSFIRDQHIGGKRKRKSIGGNERLIAKFARKRYLSEKIAFLDHDIDLTKEYLEKLEGIDRKRIMNELPKLYRELPDDLFLPSGGADPVPVREANVEPRRLSLSLAEYNGTAYSPSPSDWAAMPYKENTKFLSSKNIVTESGLRVRSKSEAGIVGVCESLGAAFHSDETFWYDAARVRAWVSGKGAAFAGASEMRAGVFTSAPIKGIGLFSGCPETDRGLISPDIVFAGRGGRLYYLEHFGLIGDPSYFEDQVIKLQIYISHGIVPGDNLILSFELPGGGIDLRAIRFEISSRL